jgi:predicted dehydrogenase
MMPAPMRVGVIGAGAIGRSHVSRLARGEAGTELAGVADARPAAAAAVAAEHGADAMTVEEMLRRPDIEAVVVAVPSGLHAEVGIAALEAGRHVLLEKPIDVTVRAADKLLRAEARTGRILTVVSQRRFAAENQLIHRLLREGALGTVAAATVEVALWRSQEYYDSGAWRGTWALDGGGALMNQGVHLVDLSLWLLGETEEVFAHTGRLAHGGIEVEDTVTISARMHGGAQLTFLATTSAYGELPIRMAVMGDRGSVVTEAERITRLTTREGTALPELELVDQQRAQLADFVAAVRTGGRPLVTASQARAAVAFIEAAYESGRTGRPVRPAPLPAHLEVEK